MAHLWNRDPDVFFKRGTTHDVLAWEGVEVARWLAPDILITTFFRLKSVPISLPNIEEVGRVVRMAPFVSRDFHIFELEAHDPVPTEDELRFMLATKGID